MKGKAAMCIVAVLSLICGGLVFAQENPASNSNATGTPKHEAVIQHHTQQHQVNVAHHVDHKAEWQRKMAERRAAREKLIAERRAAREKHLADLRAEREKLIAERKAKFHQHHTVQGEETSSQHPQ